VLHEILVPSVVLGLVWKANSREKVECLTGQRLVLCRVTYISKHGVHQDTLHLDVWPPLGDLGRYSNEACHKPTSVSDAVHCELSIRDAADTLQCTGNPTTCDLLDLLDCCWYVMVVNDRVGAVCLDQVVRVRWAGSDDFVSDEFGELNGEESDRARSALDQEPIGARTFDGGKGVALMVEETLPWAKSPQEQRLPRAAVMYAAPNVEADAPVRLSGTFQHMSAATLRNWA
jgi:hypothetical protein